MPPLIVPKADSLPKADSKRAEIPASTGWLHGNVFPATAGAG